MQIRAVEGGIATWALGAEKVEMITLWLRGGYSGSRGAWLALQQNCHLSPRNPNLDVDHPAAADDDQVIEAQNVPAVSRLKLIYVFANPADADGFAELDGVSNAVRRCLDLADREAVTSVGMMHIPFYPGGRPPVFPETGEPTKREGRAFDEISALRMVKALKFWRGVHPHTSIKRVDLVDHQNAFKHLV
jgi:hypothetical protein